MLKKRPLKYGRCYAWKTFAFAENVQNVDSLFEKCTKIEDW